VATTPDPTSAPATGQTVPGATGATSVNGAPLSGQTSSISQLLAKFSPTNLATSAVNSVTNNPLGVALGVGELGYNIYEGQKQTANVQALQNEAAYANASNQQLVAGGEALQQYLTSGTLPPRYMQQVTNAINDAITAAKSNAASQGQSTDPNQNTQLAETIANIQNQEPAMISQVASQLFTSGSSLISAGQNAAGLSGQLYTALVQNDTTQSANIGKAIASLAAALNGKTQATLGSTPITIG
jgi:hypothetical protein